MSTPAQKMQQAGSQARDEAAQRAHHVKEQAKEQAGRAVDTVQQAGNDVRENVIGPSANFLQDRMAHRPILTTFLSMFVLLSIIPALSFVIFASTTSFVVGGTATIISLGILSVVVGGASLLLGITMAVTSSISFFGTVIVGFMYAIWRMMACLMSAPTLRQGLGHFGQETRTILLGSRGGVDVDTSGDVKSATLRVQSSSST
ncbi:hypothetical protein OIO90_001176 [Microbotryomycetes sp. JL221]|nr:hypothetical protein OIO90_001176 [Microbotryomycetes sp. JL221]